jgi:hypothetical protein
LIDYIEKQSAGPVPDIDLVDTILDHHHGNARDAIRELLADADFLRDQLYTASMLMSRGMGRGWRPRYERL